MDHAIKICGLRTPETLEAALTAGADLVGFVRYPRSPRHIELAAGLALSRQARGRALRAVLVVDADDAELDAIMTALDPDLLQLHGHESPQRVAAIKTRYGRTVMKAIGIAETRDLAAIDRYANAVDHLLLDAKPPARRDALPGGNGLPFDWRLLDGLSRRTPYMLSGGLTPDNVAAAIAATATAAVDVSSGVEIRPGDKDPARIEAFIRAARAAFAAATPIKDKVA